MPPAQPSRIRLAELVALLSLGTDLGFGQPMEHVIRECLIALRLAERLGFGESERVVLYYSGLLAWVGCHTDAYELATSRLVNLADVVEVYHRSGGVEAAVAVARARSGTQFDPALVELFCREAPMLFDDLDSSGSWDAVIAAEPALERVVTDEEFEQA